MQLQRLFYKNLKKMCTSILDMKVNRPLVWITLIRGPASIDETQDDQKRLLWTRHVTSDKSWLKISRLIYKVQVLFTIAQFDVYDLT